MEAQKPQDCGTRPDVALEVLPQMMPNWMNASAKWGADRRHPHPKAPVWSLLSLFENFSELESSASGRSLHVVPPRGRQLLFRASS